jgi:thymidylate kinase
MNNRPGKLIVIYGVNNLGKTTQAKLLVKKLRASGRQAEYLKYPIYNLNPSGALLNNYLRQGNTYNLTPREAQIIFAFNRGQYEPILQEKLASGANIVAEDYIGTGLAWGLGAGIDEQFLEEINSHLLKEDLAILLDGQRFTEAIESGHKHETDAKLNERVRAAHLKLGRKYGWVKIRANLKIEQVHEQIWQEVLHLANFKVK